MKLAIVVLEGVFDTGLGAFLDAFSTANEVASLHELSVPSFDVVIVGTSDDVRTAHGMRVPARPLSAVKSCDWVIVPAINAKMPPQVIEALARADVQSVAAPLRKWHARGTRIAAACIGTFVLAESGLLAGREATTTWWLGPLFRQRYPDVELDDTRMIVASRGIVTSGAAMGHLDLALWIIREASPALAALVARYLVVDTRTSQAPYVIPNQLASADPVVEKFERFARTRLAKGFELAAAAKALGTSTRTLQRKIETVLGKTPLEYVQDLRVERAVHLLRTSDLDVQAIAAQVGYVDGTTLRTLLQRKLGRGVRELRAERRAHARSD